MIRIGLRYEGNGYFKAVSRHGLEQAQAEFDQGEAVNAELRRPRSVSQNNLFHALCEVAFDNQRDGPEFPTWRHLKSWLIIRAGACTEYRFKPESMTPEVARVLRARDDTVEVVVDRKTHEIVMRFADSISFDKMDADEATRVFDKCMDVICEKIVPGVTKEQLLEMGKRSVA